LFSMAVKACGAPGGSHINPAGFSQGNVPQ
jgi:hypothetical protein